MWTFIRNKLASVQAFKVFRHRNYKLFFIGETISISGLWMQRVAMSWLVYSITGSTVKLGALDFAGQIPVLLLGGATGAFMEGRDLRKLIFVTQVLSMLQAMLLGLRNGSTGETSTILLVLGGLFLIYRGIINWQVPAAMIGTVGILAFFISGQGVVGAFAADPFPKAQTRAARQGADGFGIAKRAVVNGAIV